MSVIRQIKKNIEKTEMRKEYNLDAKEKCPNCKQYTIFKRKEQSIFKIGEDGKVDASNLNKKKKIIFTCVRCGKEIK